MQSARSLHRWISYGVIFPGLLLAVTGVALSLMPLNEALTTGSLSPAAHVSVADVAGAIARDVPGVERIAKSANHTITADYFHADTFGTVVFDAATETISPKPEPTGMWGTLKTLHRSLFLGDIGRGVTGLTALSMLFLSVTGVWIIVGRMGGWHALIFPPSTKGWNLMHFQAIRIALVGLVIASLSGVVLSLGSFSLLPNTNTPEPVFPDLSGAQMIAIAQMEALQSTPLSQFRELIFPFDSDPTEPFTLATNSGVAFVDPATGQVTDFEPKSLWGQLYEMIYLLHTGQGAWWIGVLMGLSICAVPVAIISGVALVLTRPKSPLTGIHIAPANRAKDVILVGSEGGTTWIFAAELARKLSDAGRATHVAAINDMQQDYPLAENLFFFAATYGQGEAPESAHQFDKVFTKFRRTDISVSVLGFGDRSYPNFCGFAQYVSAKVKHAGFECLNELTLIDRQSLQAFSAWGNKIGETLEVSLTLAPRLATAAPANLTLLRNTRLGEEVNAPVSILRFEIPSKGFAKFSGGDLVGIFPPGSDVPRFYSLASSTKDGFLEICVRRQQGGLCSSHLTQLVPGARIQAFIKPNPQFRPARNSKPMILIGAGAGIGPLMGFLRGSKDVKPAHLFWGGRSEKSDYLYEGELKIRVETGQLTKLSTAFSRDQSPAYVQTRLKEQSSEILRLISEGAEILICGGVNMAQDVARTLDEILAPNGISVAQLKSQKRYLEDVY